MTRKISIEALLRKRHPNSEYCNKSATLAHPGLINWQEALTEHRDIPDRTVNDLAVRTTATDLFLSIRHSYGRGRA